MIERRRSGRLAGKKPFPSQDATPSPPSTFMTAGTATPRAPTPLGPAKTVMAEGSGPVTKAASPQPPSKVKTTPKSKPAPKTKSISKSKSSHKPKPAPKPKAGKKKAAPRATPRHFFSEPKEGGIDLRDRKRKVPHLGEAYEVRTPKRARTAPIPSAPRRTSLDKGRATSAPPPGPSFGTEPPTPRSTTANPAIPTPLTSKASTSNSSAMYTPSREVGTRREAVLASTSDQAEDTDSATAVPFIYYDFEDYDGTYSADGLVPMRASLAQQRRSSADRTVRSGAPPPGTGTRQPLFEPASALGSTPMNKGKCRDEDLPRIGYSPPMKLEPASSPCPRPRNIGKRKAEELPRIGYSPPVKLEPASSPYPSPLAKRNGRAACLPRIGTSPPERLDPRSSPTPSPLVKIEPEDMSSFVTPPNKGKGRAKAEPEEAEEEFWDASSEITLPRKTSPPTPSPIPRAFLAEAQTEGSTAGPGRPRNIGDLVEPNNWVWLALGGAVVDEALLEPWRRILNQRPYITPWDARDLVERQMMLSVLNTMFNEADFDELSVRHHLPKQVILEAICSVWLLLHPKPRQTAPP